jgi:hypothetical protein
MGGAPGPWGKIENMKSVLDHESPSFAILNRIFKNPGATFDKLFGGDPAKTTIKDYLDELIKLKKVDCSNGKYTLTREGIAQLTDKALAFSLKKMKLI